MTNKKFNELIEKAKQDQTEEYGFWGAVGSFIYRMKIQNLTINAKQFTEIAQAIIKEKF